MSKKIRYDSSWDRGNTLLWQSKFAEWEERDWREWLYANVSLPIEVVRKSDAQRNPFLAGKDEPFNVGHVLKLVAINEEHELYGIVVTVKDGARIDYLPLVELEVTSRNSRNFWPIREYVVWFAHKSAFDATAIQQAGG